jgi:STE24 endopeptidase
MPPRLFMIIAVLLLSSFIGLSVPIVNASVPDSTIVGTLKFNPDSAAQKYLNTQTPQERKSSDAYFEGGYWFLLWNLISDIFAAIIILSFGISEWIKKIAQKAGNINIQNLIYIALYFVSFYILCFPLNVYENFHREHQYNLSNMSFGGWFGEEMKNLGLLIIFGSLLIMLIYLIIRKVKRKWWIWGSLVSIVFLFISVYIDPIFIAPLFNDYKPLPESQLKNEILSMARSNGIPASNVFQFDASRQTSRISANVSGFSNTIRISLNDNLLNHCTREEIKAVVGHEIGHYVMHHIALQILFLGIIIFLGLYLIDWCFGRIILNFGARWKIKDLSDIKGLPLLVMLFTLYMFLLTPVNNNITRFMEIEADFYGLNAAGEPDGFASTAMKLSNYRKINPGYWEEIIFYDHPSGRTRVLNAMNWKAEHLNSD